MKKIILFLIFSIFFCTSSFAAISRVYRGGAAGVSFSIKDIQFKSELSVEKVTFKFGDREGKEINDLHGYYHAQYFPKLKMVSIDFSQIVGSLVDELTLKKVLLKSDLISNVHMTQDPIDMSLNVLLYLKKPVKVQFSSQQNQLLLTLKTEI